MQLYYHPVSGHSHRAHLFLSLIEADFELIEIDLKGAEHKSEAFLKINPFGQIPVLVDGTTVIADSNAILIYLAKRFARTDWLPEDALTAARIQRWLSVAAGQVAFGPAAARLITLFNAPFRAEEVIGRAHGIPEADGQRVDIPCMDRRRETDHRGCRALQLCCARSRRQGRSFRLWQGPGLAAARRSLPNLVPFRETPLTSAA